MKKLLLAYATQVFCVWVLGLIAGGDEINWRSVLLQLAVLAPVALGSILVIRAVYKIGKIKTPLWPVAMLLVTLFVTMPMRRVFNPHADPAQEFATALVLAILLNATVLLAASTYDEEKSKGNAEEEQP